MCWCGDDDNDTPIVAEVKPAEPAKTIRGTITGLSKRDAYHREKAEIIGLTGTLTLSSINSVTHGYRAGAFVADNGQSFYFAAVRVRPVAA